MNSLLKNNSSAFALFFLSLLLSMLCIYQALPTEGEYYIRADEGTYYRQAQKINEEGFSGFRTLANEYTANADLQVLPPPERIVHILFAATALKFSDTFFALSLMALLFFAIHCVVCFLFVRANWGNTIAVACGVLICVSPIAMGLARRALSDTGYYLFVTLVLFSFIRYLQKQRQIDVWRFVLFFSVAVLIKESAVFLLPFFAGVLLFEKYIQKKSISYTHIALLIFAPVAVVLLAYFITFGNTVADIFAITNKINRTAPHPYIVHYNSGPWYQYFVDYFLLSPFVSIAFMLFAGYFLLADRQSDSPFFLLLLFFLYFVIVFAFLPKNVRYAQPLDLIYRIGAVFLISEVYRKIKAANPTKYAIVTLGLLAMVTSDLMAFNNYFVKNKIYDPISYNLLQAENFFSLAADEPVKEEKPIEVVPGSAEFYLNQSLQYYQAGQYAECIEAAKKALALRPHYPVAYNNICSAYNQLKDWDRAIEAGNKALELDPNYSLARNNLNWAISQREKKVKGQ